MYTEAALLAGFDSGAKSLEAALAIGNRSAVYFHQRDWSRCEDDLEAALLYGYPEEMQYRLAERRGRAKLEQGLVFEAQESLELAGQLVRKSKLGEEQRKVFREGLKASLEEEAKKAERAPLDQGAQARGACAEGSPHRCVPRPPRPSRDWAA